MFGKSFIGFGLYFIHQSVKVLTNLIQIFVAEQLIKFLIDLKNIKTPLEIFQSI